MKHTVLFGPGYEKSRTTPLFLIDREYCPILSQGKTALLRRENNVPEPEKHLTILHSGSTILQNREKKGNPGPYRARNSTTQDHPFEDMLSDGEAPNRDTLAG
jgi:hypothetical protein